MVQTGGREEREQGCEEKNECEHTIAIGVEVAERVVARSVGETGGAFDAGVALDVVVDVEVGVADYIVRSNAVRGGVEEGRASEETYRTTARPRPNRLPERRRGGT